MRLKINYADNQFTFTLYMNILYTCVSTRMYMYIIMDHVCTCTCTVHTCTLPGVVYRNMRQRAALIS